MDRTGEQWLQQERGRESGLSTLEGAEEHSLEGGGYRTHHKGLGGWAALQKGTEGWRMTQWPGDGSPTSACVGCFEAWGQTPAGGARRGAVGTAEGSGGVACCRAPWEQRCPGLNTTTLLPVHSNPTKSFSL